MSTVIDDIRNRFPALRQKVYGRPLVYFDNAATSQREQSVLDFQNEMSRWSNANIHRAVHNLSSRATDSYEHARDRIKDFIGAQGRENIIFTSGTTASVNLVAAGFAQSILHVGDKVVISEAEHHSNIVPWQFACERAGAQLIVVPVRDNGLLCPDDVEAVLDDHTKILTIAHVTNVLGVENPIKDIIKVAHARNIPVLIDGAQGIVHNKIDVADLDCDFYVFSGHKIYAPTGIGVLYGKSEWLYKLPPYMGGGDMVGTVTFEKTTYAPLPLKFEAGTPNFIAAASLAPALDFASDLLDDVNIMKHWQNLIAGIETVLKGIEGLRLAGGFSEETGEKRTSLFSFSIEGVHPEDVAQILDKMGVAVRSGLMCAEPIVKKHSQNGLLRVSLLPYNTEEEIAIFADALKKAIKMLR